MSPASRRLASRNARLAVNQSFRPTYTRMLLKGWVSAAWGNSETNRKVRFYRLTPAGRKELETQLSQYDRVNNAIRAVLRTA